MGAPTLYIDAYPEMLESILASGKFVETFCAFVGIHKDTFYEWIKKHDEFADALKRGRAAAGADFLEKVYAGAFDPKKQPVNNGLVYLLAINCYGMTSNSDKKKESDISSIAEDLKDLANKLPT